VSGVRKGVRQRRDVFAVPDTFPLQLPAARAHRRGRAHPAIVAVPRARVEELRELLRQACGKFQQKGIYLSVAGRVEFVEGGSDAPG
jgi:hypothetical protein